MSSPYLAPNPSPGAAHQDRPTSGVAVTSFTFGMLGALGCCVFLSIPCVVAIITGHIAIGQTGEGRKSGRGLAVTGLVLGYLFFLPGLLAMFFVMFRPAAAAEIVKSIGNIFG